MLCNAPPRLPIMVPRAGVRKIVPNGSTRFCSGIYASFCGARKRACGTSDYDSLSQSTVEGFDDSSRDCCHPAAIRLADGPGRGQADYHREPRTLVEWQ